MMFAASTHVQAIFQQYGTSVDRAAGDRCAGRHASNDSSLAPFPPGIERQ